MAGGQPSEAIAACRRALAIEPDCLPAHVCMARATLPGDDYLAHLRRFHETLRPRLYVEIGVDAGRTLSLARPPTRAIGVDPAAREGGATFAADTRLFPLESDAFFAARGRRRRSPGSRSTSPSSTDCISSSRPSAISSTSSGTRRRTRSSCSTTACPSTGRPRAGRAATGFWTGDVWKIVPVLARHRPDLELFVIPTLPDGPVRRDASGPVLDRARRALRLDRGGILCRGNGTTPRATRSSPRIANDEAADRASGSRPARIYFAAKPRTSFLTRLSICSWVSFLPNGGMSSLPSVTASIRSSSFSSACHSASVKSRADKLLAPRRLALAVLAVALGAVFLVERRGMRLGGVQPSRRGRRSPPNTRPPSSRVVLHPFLAFCRSWSTASGSHCSPK